MYCFDFGHFGRKKLDIPLNFTSASKSHDLELLLWNKETLYPEKKYFLRLNAVSFKEKFFRKNCVVLQRFLMSCYLTEIFVHLPAIVAVSYFSVHKLIGWVPANIYLFKFNSRNTGKRYEICPKLATNTIESRSNVFTVKCFYCLLWIGKYLSRSSFLLKYYYPKCKDEQILYLTSFKQLIFQKLNFLNIQLIFMKKFFQLSCTNWKCCKLNAINFFPFSLTFTGSSRKLRKLVAI